MPARPTDSYDPASLGLLLLEDVCSDLVRFLHSRGEPNRFGAVRIDREYALGAPGAFADLRVEPDGERPYFMEVKYGYDVSRLLAHMKRKYGVRQASEVADRVVLVVDTAPYANWRSIDSALRGVLAPELTLEIWDEHRLRTLMADCFGQPIPALSLTGPELGTIRELIDQGKERIAFGEAPPRSYAEAILRQDLIWHLGAWRLRELRQAGDLERLSELVPPAVYDHVVVLIADLSGFSRYMRDTPDDATVRQSLTNFYAKARYQVINAGGMIVQFVGDNVVALFGVPDQRPGYVESAVRTSFRLLDIAASVSLDWQRRIDHVQPRSGAHVSMAMGRVQLVAMRPLDHARLASLGDCIDIASRLLPLADQGQVVVSNVLRHALRHSSYEFAAREPFDARNVGVLKAWQMSPGVS